MAETQEISGSGRKFAGIEVPSDLTRTNFFFLYFNTMLMGVLMAVLAILQPAFLKDIIKVSPDFFGSINGLLMNINEIATLALVGLVGALSDRTGRKILAFLAFIVLGIFFYLLGQSNGIASLLQVPVDFSAKICALLSFAPSRAAEFAEYSPGLLITYVIRLVIGIGLVLGYPQFITMVADYTYEKDRGKGMGLNGLMMGVASLLVFAILAPILKQIGVAALFVIVAVGSLFGAVSTGVFLKERLPETKNQKKGVKEIIGIVRASLPLKASYICTLITRADIVVLAAFVVSWAVKVGENYGLNSEAATQRIAIPMIVMSLASFISFPVAGILLDKWGRVPTIILALLSGSAGMMLLSVAPSPFHGIVFVALIFSSFGMAGAITGANTLATDASPKDVVGAVLGGLNTMQPIGILFFVGLGGYLFDVFGPGWAFAVKGIASLILCVWLFMIKGQVSTALLEKS
jgi:MFS family permease